MDASEIKQALAARAVEVARHLLPAGKRKGDEWVVGSLDGEPGSSFKVNLGVKAGVYSDFATGEEGGNFLDLWMRVRGVDFAAACSEARDFLGLPPSNRALNSKLAAAKAKEELQAVKEALASKERGKPLDADDPVFAYLTEERNLSPEVLSKYAVRQGQIADGDTRYPAILFSMNTVDGATQNLKRIGLERDERGKKRIKTVPRAPHALFGKDVVGEPNHEEKLLIAEGEIDALSWASLGHPAVSVPFGASNHDWLENDFDYVDGFGEIIIAFDEDDAGRDGADALIQRIGREKCLLLEMPDGVSDANEALQKGMGDQLLNAYHGAKPAAPPELRHASDFFEEVEVCIRGEGVAGLHVFFTGGWEIRPGEVTMWAGFSGHGKTVLLSQVQGDLLEAGEKVCVASLEQRPSKTLLDMVRQRSGNEEPNRDDLRGEWLSRLWFYDHVGTRDWREIIEVFKYAYRRFGVTQFVIDSLLKCGIAGDDYDGQRKFVEGLADFVNEFPVHVHLVAHARKMQDESRPPDKLDVKGSGDITDLVWNGITVWRNKAKERGLVEARMKGDTEHEAELRTQPDAKVLLWKQRETGEEPMAFLNFNPDTKTFSTA